MILVTGATGHLGKAVVNGLLKKIKPAEIAVLVRQEAQAAHFRDLGVDFRIGDYNEFGTLVKALTVTDLWRISPGNLYSTAIQQEEFAKISLDLEQLQGRKPSTLNAFITSHYSSN